MRSDMCGCESDSGCGLHGVSGQVDGVPGCTYSQTASRSFSSEDAVKLAPPVDMPTPLKLNLLATDPKRDQYLDKCTQTQEMHKHHHLQTVKPR